MFRKLNATMSSKNQSWIQYLKCAGAYCEADIFILFCTFNTFLSFDMFLNSSTFPVWFNSPPPTCPLRVPLLNPPERKGVFPGPS